jgi:uncharacterized repeat protein (TIGR03803 family)
VFKINTDGSGFATLYSFSAAVFNPANPMSQTNSDGAQPTAGLVLSGSTLYGAASAGGPGGSGTIFSVDTNGANFVNLYSFTFLPYGPPPPAPASTNLDGANPAGTPVLADGVLYAATSNGGPQGEGALLALGLPGAPSTLVSTWPAASPLTYGQALSASVLSGGVASVAGAFSFSAPATVPQAGAYSAPVTFTPTDTLDYQPVAGSVDVSVAPLPLTVTGLTANDKVYDGTTAETLSTNNVGLAGALSGDMVTLDVSGYAAAFAGPDAGSDVAVSVTGLTLDGADAADYSLVPPVLAANITPAPLTITANSGSKVYGQTVTFAGTEFTSGGLLSTDTVTSVTLVSAGAPAAATVAGSPYSVVPSAAAGSGLANYSVSYVNGTLAVNPAPLTITALQTNKLYGAPLPALAAWYSGFANGDTASSLTTPPTLSTTATPASPAGSYLITASGAVDANYAMSYLNGTFTVNPAPLTVTANNATRLYGQANPAFSGTLTGLQNGDNITPVFTCTAAVTSPPGAYPITPGLLDPGLRLSNYTVTTNAGVLTIVPPSMSVVQRSGSVGFTWPTSVGLSYQVQFTTSLFEPNWTDLGPPTAATNSAMTVLDAIQPGHGRYYRLLILP